ncbi:MAG: hypothetical protein ACK2UH_16555, partial [Candidatus Promineifilaceae bacterium]
YGLYPVSEWQPGDLIRHEQVIRLPALPPGTEYEIVVGLWYGQGRPALTGPEQLLGGDVLRIASIVVENGRYRLATPTTD